MWGGWGGDWLVVDQILRDSKIQDLLPYLKCCLTCFMCQQAQNPGVTKTPSLCAQCTVRSKNTKTLFGTEKGLLQVHARRWVANALRTP